MRTLALMPSGSGQWQVKMMPFNPRAAATDVYSTGSPTACLHRGVWQWDS